MISKLLERLQRRQKVHFLHISKTGGTAIKSALSDHLRPKLYEIKLHGHDVKLRNIPEGEKVIFFLRDPISKFVSGFYSRQRKGRPRYDSEWSKHEEEAFSTFGTPNELALSLSDERCTNHALAVKAMTSIQHLDHYHNWFENKEYFESRINDIFFIGFQETLNADFHRLKQLLGLPASSTLPKDDIGAHKNPEHLDKSLDPSAMDALNEWYESDLEFIAACKELMSLRAAGGL